MHKACWEWMEREAASLQPRFVLEVGSLDVNGSVRPLFAGVERYHGIDRLAGPCVDEVVEFMDYQPADAERPDVIVSCSALEHSPHAYDMVRKMVGLLAPGGVLLLTTVQDPWPVHSADGGGLQDGEHYEHIDTDRLADTLLSLGGCRYSLSGTPDGDVFLAVQKHGGTGPVRVPHVEVAPEPGRLLLVGAGADTSVKDVEVGYLKALRALGNEVWHYNLEGRLGVAGGYLRYSWQRARKTKPDTAEPTFADVLYLAGSGTLERSLRSDLPWVVIVSGMYLHPDWMIMLKRAGRRLAVLFTESPYDDVQQAPLARLADICFTNERTSVDFLRQHCANVHYLPHAYDPEQHRPYDTPEYHVPGHDVVFVGTGFPERVELLSAVDWSGIDLGLYGNWEEHMVPKRHKLRPFVRGGVVPNPAVAAMYRRSRIGLNLHRNRLNWDGPAVTTAESVNPRAIELAACGAFTISDYRAEVGELFGDLVPTFETPEQLEGLIRHYLAHPEQRDARRMALPSAVRGRTFEANAAVIMRHLAAASVAVAV